MIWRRRTGFHRLDGPRFGHGPPLLRPNRPVACVLRHRWFGQRQRDRTVLHHAPSARPHPGCDQGQGFRPAKQDGGHKNRTHVPGGSAGSYHRNAPHAGQSSGGGGGLLRTPCRQRLRRSRGNPPAAFPHNFGRCARRPLLTKSRAQECLIPTDREIGGGLQSLGSWSPPYIRMILK